MYFTIFSIHIFFPFFSSPLAGVTQPQTPPTDLKSSLLPLSKVRSLNNQMVACWSTEKRIEGGSPTLIWHSSLKIKSFRYVKRICQKRSQRSNRRRKFIGPSRDCNFFSRSWPIKLENRKVGHTETRQVTHFLYSTYYGERWKKSKTNTHTHKSDKKIIRHPLMSVNISRERERKEIRYKTTGSGSQTDRCDKTVGTRPTKNNKERKKTDTHI